MVSGDRAMSPPLRARGHRDAETRDADRARRRRRVTRYPIKVSPPNFLVSSRGDTRCVVVGKGGTRTAKGDGTSPPPALHGTGRGTRTPDSHRSKERSRVFSENNVAWFQPVTAQLVCFVTLRWRASRTRLASSLVTLRVIGLALESAPSTWTTHQGTRTWNPCPMCSAGRLIGRRTFTRAAMAIAGGVVGRESAITGWQLGARVRLHGVQQRANGTKGPACPVTLAWMECARCSISVMDIGFYWCTSESPYKHRTHTQCPRVRDLVGGDHISPQMGLARAGFSHGPSAKPSSSDPRRQARQHRSHTGERCHRVIRSTPDSVLTRSCWRVSSGGSTTRFRGDEERPPIQRQVQDGET